MMFVYITFDPRIIRRIADIDYSLHDVIQSGVRFFQQGFDILNLAAIIPLVTDGNGFEMVAIDSMDIGCSHNDY